MGEVAYISVDDTARGYMIVRRQEGRPDVYYDGYFDDRREMFRLYYSRRSFDNFGDWKPPRKLEVPMRAVVRRKD